MIVQIYAAVSVSEALSMVDLGVDQVGFVAGLYEEVHGELSFGQARALAAALRGKAQSSALTMSSDLVEIQAMARAVQPDIVHISSGVDDVDLGAMQHLRRNLPPEMMLMKAIPVFGEKSIEIARQYSTVADILLLDTAVDGFPGVGATGVTHDWNISRRIVEAAAQHARVILAGGLTPENVADAIRVVRPYGVDSNTGTNLPNDPVAKDMSRVRDFVARAKSMSDG